VQKLFATLQIINFFFASLKLLTNFEKMLPETLLKFLSSVIGRCSLVPTYHWLQGKRTRINFSQAAFRIILQ
jgi:hypothetical protein